MKKMVLIAIAATALLTFFVTENGLAAIFMELQPGRSTKADADRKLGPPLKEVVSGIQYDYPPRMDARRLSVIFHPETMVVKSIDLYSGEPFFKSEYREWLQLEGTPETSRGEDGHLIEAYPAKGIALHFSGPDDAATVEYISYYDVAPAAPPQPKKSLKKRTFKAAPAKPARESGEANGERYYGRQADLAFESKDWPRLKKIVEEGLRRYPDSADLWHSRALYFFNAKSEPGRLRVDEAKNSMYRAYQLDPSGKHAAEMGWLHKEFHNDCTLALSYFEEAERKGHADSSPSLLYWMGHCYEDIGMYTSAGTYYRRYMDKAPGGEKRTMAEAALNRLPE